MYGVAFVFWLCFVLRMNQDLMECCVWFLRCVDVVFFHCSLDTFRNSPHTAVSPFLCVLGYLFFFFLPPALCRFCFWPVLHLWLLPTVGTGLFSVSVVDVFPPVFCPPGPWLLLCVHAVPWQLTTCGLWGVQMSRGGIGEYAWVFCVLLFWCLHCLCDLCSGTEKLWSVSSLCVNLMLSVVSIVFRWSVSFWVCPDLTFSKMT